MSSLRSLIVLGLFVVCAISVRAQDKPLIIITLNTGEVITVPEAWDDTANVWFVKDGKTVLYRRHEVKSIDRPPVPDFQTSDFYFFLVKDGETISRLATRYGRDAEEAARLNGIPANEPLPKGTQVRIPRTRREGRSPLPAAEKLPPSFAGVNPLAVFKAFGAVRDELVKSKFETTAEYEARLTKLLGRVNLEGTLSAGEAVTIVIPERVEDYDADMRTYSVRLLINQAVPYALLLDRTVRTPFSLSDTVASAIRLSDGSKPLGSSVGQNAFGVKKRYSIRAYSYLDLVVPDSKVAAFRDGIIIQGIAPERARRLTGRVYIALRGKLAHPFISDQTSKDAATIATPEEAHRHNFYIYFEPESIIAFDKLTGEVLGTANFNTLPKDESRFRRSSKLILYPHGW